MLRDVPQLNPDYPDPNLSQTKLMHQFASVRYTATGTSCGYFTCCNLFAANAWYRIVITMFLESVHSEPSESEASTGERSMWLCDLGP